jgi:hypothetical protein
MELPDVDMKRVAKVRAMQDQCWTELRMKLPVLERIGREGPQPGDERFIQFVCLSVAGRLHLGDFADETPR